MPASLDATLRFRRFTAADVPAAHALSVYLRWPHRAEDWAMVQRTCEGFVAEHEGRLIGTAFACHQGDYSSIGLVIVSDEYQGKGIGRRLMDLCLEAAAPRTPFLNATESGAPLYAKMGFVDYARIQQHQGVPQLPLATPSTVCRALTNADHPRVIELSNAASGLDRTVVLNDLFPIVEHAVGVEIDGQLQGVALMRPFGRGRCIGPVVAQTPEQAQ